MKKHVLLALSCFVVLAIFILSRDDDQETTSNENPPQTTPVAIKPRATSAAVSTTPENTDHIPLREVPAEMPTLVKSSIADPTSTAALIKIISRHPEETIRLEEENQWIKRREIVEREESFRDVARRILDGEKVAELQIPLFDGETATFLIDHEKSKIYSETSGSFHGSIEGDPDAFAVLSYYENSDSGLVNLPARDLTVQYEGWGDQRVIVKDFDEQAQARALPCAHCRIEGSSSNHGNHSPVPSE